jgi:glycosyltransferase involved in cell wall biosynthesis
MTRLLIVSYLFPPVGGVGVQRALSLAKYLPECGFEVHVLKARNAAGPVNDPGLLKHVPASVRIHEAFTPELPFHFRQKVWRWFGGGKSSGQEISATKRPSRNPWWKRLPVVLVRRILCPEPEVLWVPFALRKARQIVRKYGIEAVLVTAPPFSAFLVGNALKEEFPGLKLIADFRDEWLSFYLTDFDFQSSDYTRRRAEEIERATVEYSDLVVAVASSSLRVIRQRYPEEPDEKFVLLTNGYDPEVFARFTPRKHNEPKVVVTHVGTVYKTASPRHYLDALDEVPEEIRSWVETRFVGRIAETERGIFESRKSAIRLLEFMPQSEALRQMEDADYLLLTMTNDISLPGKLFEYLATGKPILALSPRGGEVAQILRETGAGWCVDPNDHIAIQEMIMRACRLANSGEWSAARDEAAIRRFERPRLAAEYGELIRRTVLSTNRAPCAGERIGV